MRYAFIINFFADRKKREKVEASIQALASQEPDHVFVNVTERPGHAAQLAADYAAKYGSDIIVFALGGDGTVHEISNALAFTGTPMAVLPLGTGNDFARSVLSLEQYLNPQVVIEHIKNVTIRPMDMMRVTPMDKDRNAIPGAERFSVNITSFGLDTMIQAEAKRLVAKSRKSRFIRKNAYTLAIVSSLIRGWNFRMRYELTLENKQKESDVISYCLACISNGRYYGNGFFPSPDGRLDDGVLEVCIVEDMPLIRTLPLIPKYKKGTHTKHPKIRMRRITSCVLSSENKDTPLSGNYEGEDFSASIVQIEVVPEALQFAFFSI